MRATDSLVPGGRWLPMARTFRQQRHLRDSKNRENNERNERQWWFLAVCGVLVWGLRRVRESHVRLSGPEHDILIAFIFLYSFFYFSYLCFLINPIMCDRKPHTEQIVPSHRPENSWFMCQVWNHHPEEVYLLPSYQGLIEGVNPHPSYLFLGPVIHGTLWHWVWVFVAHCLSGACINVAVWISIRLVPFVSLVMYFLFWSHFIP